MTPMNTKLTRLLGLKTPIISAPMYSATTPAMAAAATRAGGFGFLATGFISSQTLIEELSTVRSILNAPPNLPIPVGIGFVGCILDQTELSPDPRIPAVLAQRPVAIWLAFGTDLGKYVAQIRAYDAGRTPGEEHNTLIFCIVSSVDEALQATNDWGVDVLVVQGTEAGGHGGVNAPSLSTLLSTVLTAIPSNPNRPVIVAAGGISTGSQIASLLTMGADGIVLGSRLLCTPECMYPENSKEVILHSDSNATVRSDVFDQVNRTAFWPEEIDGRAIVNDVVKDARDGLSLEERLQRYDTDKAGGKSNRLVIWAGEGVGLVNDRKSTEDIIHQLHEEAVVALQNAAELLKSL